MARKQNGTDATPQKRGASTRRKNRKRELDAFRRGRRQGWKDCITAYRGLDEDGFRDWLSTVSGVEL